MIDHNNSLENEIRDQSYEGERPLFGLHDSTMLNVHFYPGESALKHSRNICAKNCEFMGKYPFWHSEGLRIENCKFTNFARAAIWYTQDLFMRECVVDAPKMFRSSSRIEIEDTQFSAADETFWNCRELILRKVELKNADYVFMNSKDIKIDGLRLQGNYSFQDAQDVTIRNSIIESKDAFWGAKNVTIYDSVLEGEYLGWHSKNLRLVNCMIRGSQPLCYASNLKLENCRMENTDLCFEYSIVDADIASEIQSVKNPKGGLIRAKRIGAVIIDDQCLNPGACKIETQDSYREVGV